MSFRNPEMKYRSLPFYAWNGRLEKDELRPAGLAAPSSRYDGAAYVNVLDKEAINEFLRVTYDRYAEAVGGAAEAHRRPELR